MQLKFSFFFYFIFLSNLFSQDCLNDVDLNKIPQLEIRNLLTLQQKQNINCISDIEATCSENTSVTEFYKQIRVYKICDGIEHVWKNYSQDSPAKVYNTGKFSFGLMLCKNPSKILYSDDNFGKIEKGQVIYLKLRFLKGLYKMAVAFEILEVDSVNKFIEFSYIKGGNKASGKQRVQFVDTKKGRTKIIHTSYYKSNILIRDKFLYPFFHAKITNAFHHNLRKIIALNLKENKASTSKT